MSKLYTFDVTLKMDLFRAKDKREAYRMVNEYIDQLANVPGLTWSEVDPTLVAEEAK